MSLQRYNGLKKCLPLKNKHFWLSAFYPLRLSFFQGVDKSQIHSDQRDSSVSIFPHQKLLLVVLDSSGTLVHLGPAYAPFKADVEKIK